MNHTAHRRNAPLLVVTLALWLVPGCSLFDRGSDDDPAPAEEPVASNQPAQSGDTTTGNTTGNQGIQVPGMPGVNVPNPFPNNNGQGNAQGNTGSGNTGSGNTGSGNTGSGNTGSGDGNTKNKGLQIPGLSGLKLPFPTKGGSSGSGDSGTEGASGDPEPPARGTLSPAPYGSYDPEGLMTSEFIRSRTQGIHKTLIAALNERERNMMSGVPFEIANESREPNAAAVCTKRSNRPFMLVTTAMLVVAAGIAETKSYDEVTGTNYFDAYIDAVVRQVRSRRPVGAVPRGLLTGPTMSDPHKLARQVHLFDQQVAFIIGHEMAHHYRGHTGCVSASGNTSKVDLSPEEISRILSRTAPIFHQPQEVEADMWGIVNLLEAGHGRQGGRWTEEGALHNMGFFARLRRRGGEEIFRSFFSTHPMPQLRMPIIRQTARQWSPGWRPTTTPGVENDGLQIPTPIGNVPLPVPLPQPGKNQ